MRSDDRLLDLLATRATEGLSPQEERELARELTVRHDVDTDGLELAAAAIYLAFDAGEQGQEPMPDPIRARLFRDSGG